VGRARNEQRERSSVVVLVVLVVVVVLGVGGDVRVLDNCSSVVCGNGWRRW
jgi:hypothetical protein